MPTSHDALVHWLLGQFVLQTTVVHVGQYCGAWQASTAGHERGSFHLVLRGQCWLHRPDHPPLALQAGDSVFLLRDLPHRLLPSADAAAHDAQPPACEPMRPMAVPLAGATGLACGFFGYAGSSAGLLLGTLPELLVLRGDDASTPPVAQLFGLIRAEAALCDDPETPSPLLARLVETLFFYVLREVARRSDWSQTGHDLWALARDARLAPLLVALLQAPESDWTLERMAAHVALSRAALCRRFAEVCGQPPAQFVQRVRMHVAARRLAEGATVEVAALDVGYASVAAFTRAFQRVHGRAPGQWRRLMH
jgi:AraC-like DNA-binding protein/quercetin dioxygenase-like cupin family protein